MDLDGRNNVVEVYDGYPETVSLTVWDSGVWEGFGRTSKRTRYHSNGNRVVDLKQVNCCQHESAVGHEPQVQLREYGGPNLVLVSLTSRVLAPESETCKPSATQMWLPGSSSVNKHTLPIIWNDEDEFAHIPMCPALGRVSSRPYRLEGINGGAAAAEPDFRPAGPGVRVSCAHRKIWTRKEDGWTQICLTFGINRKFARLVHFFPPSRRVFSRRVLAVKKAKQ